MDKLGIQLFFDVFFWLDHDETDSFFILFPGL